ncbi:MAG: aminoglycoside phosphotransferase family protein, partial [Bauldia sp.]
MADEDSTASTRDALVAMGLVPSGVAPEMTRLTGGVSSDIWLVRTPERVFVVKRALAKLRVAADWRAPVSRNAGEVEWLKLAAAAAPGAVPEVLAHDATRGLFAMAYLPPEQYPVWKMLLRDGHASPAFAGRVGATVVRIHASTAGRTELAAALNDDALFRAIRLEPYFEFTATRHPEIEDELNGLVAGTLATKRAVVHGDVSPKNILAGPDGPVFLDAECAWYGDPAFDVAFCLNHLLLKCLWTPGAIPEFLASFDRLADAYLGGVTWEPRGDIEARAARLLPALFLARIDG